MKITAMSGRNNPAYGFIVVHHAGGIDSDPKFDTSYQTFDVINDYHRERWNGETESSLGYFCGYHYVIDRHGNVTQARLDTDEGAHTIGVNRRSLGVCLIGNFDVNFPTAEQIKSMVILCTRKLILWNIPITNVVPHRKFATKSCFGMLLSDNWAQNEIMKFDDLGVVPPFGGKQLPDFGC